MNSRIAKGIAYGFAELGADRLGSAMSNIRIFLKKAFTSVTIMVIPHDNLRALNLKVPAVGLIVSIMLAMIGGGYVLCLAVSGLQYKAQHYAMAEKVKFYGPLC
jgi:hypothetical protein